MSETPRPEHVKRARILVPSLVGHPSEFRAKMIAAEFAAIERETLVRAGLVVADEAAKVGKIPAEGAAQTARDHLAEGLLMIARRITSLAQAGRAA